MYIYLVGVVVHCMYLVGAVTQHVRVHVHAICTVPVCAFHKICVFVVCTLLCTIYGDSQLLDSAHA